MDDRKFQDTVEHLPSAALDAFLRLRVAEITKGRQTPVSAKTPASVPFPVVLLK